MQTKDVKNKRNDKREVALILLLCCITILFDFITIRYTQNDLHNRYISKIIQQSIGTVAVIILMKRLNIQLFGWPQKWLFLIPCLIVAIDNFQWSSYLNGRMELLNSQPIDFILFGLYCLSVGMFEECIFRGVIFGAVAGRCTKDKKGLWRAYIISSLIFGAAHLFNGISGATILQVGYTFLTGGLFAFVLLKTKNIFCCGFIHALYNFCGMLFESSERMGLGNGVVFDLGTVFTMLIISVLIGLFVLNSVKKYSIEEQTELYKKLGISMKKEEK